MTDSTKIEEKETIIKYDKLDDFSKLFDKLKKKPDPDDSSLINSILIKIPEDKDILKDQIIEKINEISGVEIATLEMTYKGLHEDVFSKLFKELEINPIKEPIINSILIKIPIDKYILKDQTFRKIKKITGITLPTLRTIYKELHEPEKKLTKKDEYSKTNRLLFLKATMEDENPKNKYMVYDDKLIEIAESEINLWELPYKKSSKYERNIVFGSNLDILYKTLDHRKDNITLFTFKKDNILYHNYEVTDFIRKFDSEIIKKRIGTEVIKYIFAERSKYIKSKTPKYISGFNNGWYLPIDEDKNDYTIISYTAEQKEIFQNCKNIYKRYTDKEKLKIKSDFKEFIERTQIRPDYLAIIMGWTMMAPFKLYFIYKYQLFPHLILMGKYRAGKTSFIDLTIVSFFKHYKEHIAGSTINVARFENIMTGSTLPIVIDEFDVNKKFIVNLLKELATGRSDYMRMTSGFSHIKRPKVVPIATTSNELIKYFIEPADRSRAIILDFNIPIIRDPIWVDLKEKLEKEKLFSLMYDYTKDWNNNNLDKLIKETIEKYKIEEHIKLVTSLSEKSYPRIKETYIILSAGNNLLEKIFGIKLDINIMLNTLIESRKRVSYDLLSKFIDFCRLKLNYDPEKYSKYVTCELMVDKHGRYIFGQIDLNEFNSFNNSNYSLRKLEKLLKEGLTNKKLVIYTNISMRKGDVRKWYIAINPILLKEIKKVGETTMDQYKKDKKIKKKSKETKEKKEDITFGKEVEGFDWY